MGRWARPGGQPAGGVTGAGCFGLVGRSVGPFDEVGGVGWADGVGDTDAGAGMELEAVDGEGGSERAGEVVAETVGVVRWWTGEEDDELVAPDPADEAVIADGSLEASCHDDEELVPDVVAVGVVDRFELVEIDVENGNGLRLGDGQFESVVELSPVGQVGEGVVGGLMADAVEMDGGFDGVGGGRDEFT